MICPYLELVMFKIVRTVAAWAAYLEQSVGQPGC